MKIAVIIGTSRLDGDIVNCIKVISEKVDMQIFDLSDLDISFYDYEHRNKDDDFLPLVTELLSFDHWIFASPMYWYSMSAQMKVFIDRLSDLLTIEKDLGRRLKGKSCSLVSTGYDLTAPDCLWQPFDLTAKYLHMDYMGMAYCPCPDGFVVSEHQGKLNSFIDNIVGS